MLKRVKIQDIRCGMYVQELDGSWLHHPFWKTSFAVSSQEMLNKLRESGVSDAWIDTDRGLDVAVEPVAPAGADPDPAARPGAEETAPARAPDQPAPVPAPAVATRLVATSLGEEVLQAHRVREKGKRVVSRLVREARLGRLNTGEALSLVEEISDSVMRNPDAFISVARLKHKDEYTYLHSVATCALMIALARQLQFPDEVVRIAGYAGLLHDIGKVSIPVELLNKPAALTDEEFRIVKSHPMAGVELLRGSGDVPEEVIDVVMHHHERMDGMGYPDRLKGAGISTLAKMGAVCDVYDAVTSDRPYKRGWTAAEAVRRMATWTGNHFDDRIFHAFVKCVGIYPVGQLVRLSSDRLAVVVGQGDESLLTPRVKVFFSIRNAARILPEIVDLASSPDKIVSPESAETWGLQDIDALWQRD